MMNRVTRSEKILRKINCSTITVFLLICIINIGGSAVVAAIFDGKSFIQSLLMNSVITGYIYILLIFIITSINMTHTGVDYLISVNTDRKSIFHAIMRIIVYYTIILNLIFAVILALNSRYGFVWGKNVILFGMRGNELNVLSYLILFLYLCIIGYFIMVYMMFIVLLAKCYGWYYLVGTLLLTLSLVVICFNEIRLLFIIGDMIPISFVGGAITCLILTLINKILVEKVEYKK